MRHLTAVALTLAVALPVCAQRGAHAGFAGRSAPSFHPSAGFHSAPSPMRSPQVFPGARPTQGFARQPIYPRTFTLGSSPYGRPVMRPMHQPPHGFAPARPTFYHRDRDRDFRRDRREFINPGFGLYAYPVVQGFTFWPYGDDLIDQPYSDQPYIDQPYNDQTYNDLSNDGLAPGPPANEPDAYPPNGYPEPPPPGYAPQSAPAVPPPSPEMQYVPGSADKVTLIFKDGRPPEEIQNYLATSSTITVLEGHRRRQIPVAALDLPATIRANQQTGVEFQLPTAAK